MPLTKEQIIEIQTAAAFNQRRRAKEYEEQKALKKEVAEALAKAKPAVKAEAKESDKKGK